MCKQTFSGHESDINAITVCILYTHSNGDGRHKYMNVPKNVMIDSDVVLVPRLLIFCNSIHVVVFVAVRAVF